MAKKDVFGTKEGQKVPKKFQKNDRISETIKCTHIFHLPEDWPNQMYVALLLDPKTIKNDEFRHKSTTIDKREARYGQTSQFKRSGSKFQSNPLILITKFSKDALGRGVGKSKKEPT